jgi:hypothetical protein
LPQVYRDEEWRHAYPNEILDYAPQYNDLRADPSQPEPPKDAVVEAIYSALNRTWDTARDEHVLSLSWEGLDRLSISLATDLRTLIRAEIDAERPALTMLDGWWIVRRCTGSRYETAEKASWWAEKNALHTAVRLAIMDTDTPTALDRASVDELVAALVRKGARRQHTYVQSGGFANGITMASEDILILPQTPEAK